jgi:hypothetical protein
LMRADEAAGVEGVFEEGLQVVHGPGAMRFPCSARGGAEVGGCIQRVKWCA